LLQYYNAADALFLASRSEGMPNAALESMACGTPVVAAPFAGVSEVLSAPEAGEVAASRTAEAMIAAWQRLQERKLDRAATRRCAEQFGWTPVIEQQCGLYRQVIAAHHGAMKQGATA
jgi:glycosyltransferase involved in cell wall biosynthesis